MKCSHAKKEIGSLIYRKEPMIKEELLRHIETCEACAKYLEESKLAGDKIAGLGAIKPVLHDPEGLTDDIMAAIRALPVERPAEKPERTGNKPLLLIVQRLLAAASICLLVAFAYEEYVVVDKISQLEKQNAAISKSSQYQSALQVKKVISIISADPDILNQFLDLKTKKINLRTMLRAAMYADMAPDARKMINRTSNEDYLSIIKQFDSTLLK
jgi:hypothetical protein